MAGVGDRLEAAVTLRTIGLATIIAGVVIIVYEVFSGGEPRAGLIVAGIGLLLHATSILTS